MKIPIELSKPRWQFVSFLLTLLAFGLLYLVMPIEVTVIGTALAVLALVYVLIQRQLTDSRLRLLVMILWPILLIGLLGWGAWLVWTGELDLLSYLFIIPMALVYFQFLSVVPFAFYQSYTDYDHFEPQTPLPSVSAIVPAYNEEKYIGRAIQSLLSAAYPEDKLEVIVVDDGSTDQTLQRANAYANDRVRVFHKENGGKHSALNYGLLFAEGEIIVTIDADCIVHSNAIREIVASFQVDPTIGAVAGDIRLINRHSLLMRLQALEYAVGINLLRRMFDWFGGVPVVPGCLGAFRQSALEAVSYYDPDTLTEDYDLTLKLLKAGYDVRTSPALAYTEVPDTWRSLYRQRIRWYRGNLMTHLKHSDVFFEPKYGVLHSITFPLRMIAMTFGTITTVLVILTVVIAFASGAFVTILTIFAVFMLISTLSTLLALQFRGEDLSLAPYTPLLATIYKLFRDAIMLKALVDVLFQSDLDWTSPTRIRHRSELESESTHHEIVDD